MIHLNQDLSEAITLNEAEQQSKLVFCKEWEWLCCNYITLLFSSLESHKNTESINVQLKVKTTSTTLSSKELSSNKLSSQGKVHISSGKEGQSWNPKDMLFPLLPKIL